MSGSAFSWMLDSAEVQALFGPRAVVQAMLDVEAALSAAQAELGLITAAQAEVVQACCRLEDHDVGGLVQASQTAGSLAIPLVQSLTRRVRERDPSAVAAVHRGATSQDIIDTAFCLQARQAHRLLEADLNRLIESLIDLHRRHGQAPMLARTLMQPATVSTFGARLLNWTAPLLRSREQLRALAPRALRLQLGAAVGNGAAWGVQAQALAQAMARHLHLPDGPDDVQPWHVQRDEFARLCAELGVLTGAVGKIAVDVSLMAQAEVGELHESAGAGRGGSSAMPHKRNPVGSLVARGALHRAAPRVAAVLGAMAHEHERALGAWQAELTEAAELWAIACGAVRAMADAMDGAQVDEHQMHQRIEDLRGLPMAEALARHWADPMGRDQAHQRVQALSVRVGQEGLHLRDLALQAVVDPEEVERLKTLFDPRTAASIGAANTQAAWRALLERQERFR